MPGPRSYRSDGAEPGFTLIEALVALAILGTAVIGAVGALRGGLRTQAGVDAHITAVALAERRMMELDALPRDSLRVYGGGRSGAFEAPFSDYGWTVRARQVDAGPDGLLEILVRVAWAGGVYDLATTVYRPDPLPRALRSGP